MKGILGILKAKSIQNYGLFDEKEREVYSFTVTDPKKRNKFDLLQGKAMSVEDIDKLL